MSDCHHECFFFRFFLELVVKKAIIYGSNGSRKFYVRLNPLSRRTRTLSSPIQACSIPLKEFIKMKRDYSRSCEILVFFEKTNVKVFTA
jgi:hypothetical protein